MYSLISDDIEEVNKGKGVNKKLKTENLLMFCLIKKLLDTI